MMDEEDGRQHFSLEAIQQAEGDKKKKRKKKKKGQQEEQASMSQDDFQVILGENRACHPGGHYWNYNPGAQSLSQVTAAHLKIRHP